MTSKAQALERFDVKDACASESAIKMRKRRRYALFIIGILSVLVVLN